MNKILKERSNKKKKSAAEIDKLDGAQRLDGRPREILAQRKMMGIKG